MEGQQNRLSVRSQARKLANISPSTWDKDKDLEGAVEDFKVKKQTWPMFWGLSYRAIGVVYGDLGTSPLYTYPTVFANQPSRLAIYGSCSLILWILMLQLFIKYICITLYADDNSEGGTFAVYSLLCRHIGITPFGREEASDTSLSHFSSSRGVGDKPRMGSRLAESTKGESVDQTHSSQGRMNQDQVRKEYKKKLESLREAEREALRFDITKHSNVLEDCSDFALSQPLHPWPGERQLCIRRRTALQQMLLLLVLLGTSMLLGDGVLTCAIEVLSAIDGLKYRVDVSQGVVVGVTCVVLLLLFLIQRMGTSRIGVLFSPILIIWFIVNAALGIYNVVKYEPGIFAAFNPACGVRWLVQEGKPAWISLGGVILCVTGAEAMFTDMGHFSRAAIQFTTLAVVMPSCMLTYLGEAAYLTSFPETYTNPYFAAIPEPIYWPVFVVATAASVVAAQSLITATFSIVKQSAALNCFPPLKVVQTSSAVAGQVYLPAVNWSLMVGSIAVVAAFQTTASIGNAFGVAFISVMLVTTLLVGLVMLVVWKLHPLLPAAFLAVFLTLEGIPASALLYKVPHGAWFPLALGAVIVAVSYLWHYGCSQRLAFSTAHARQLSSLICMEHGNGAGGLVLVEKSRKVSRVPGLALYFSDNLRGLPEAFTRLITKLPAVHQTVVFVTVRKVPLPTTSADERFLIRPLQLPGFFRVIARYGYQDIVDQGPPFLDDLTTRIAALVRYNALTGGTGALVDSAAEIPHTAAGTPARAAVAEQPDAGTKSADSVTASQPPAAWSVASSSADVGKGLAGGRLAAPECASGRQSLGGESTEGMALLGQDTDAANLVLRARAEGVVYVLSKSTLLAKPGSNWARRLALEVLYPFLVNVSRPPSANWKIPTADVVEVGVAHEA